MGLRRKTRTLRGCFYGKYAQFEPLEQRRLLSAAPISGDFSSAAATAVYTPSASFGTGTLAFVPSAISVPATQTLGVTTAQAFVSGSDFNAIADVGAFSVQTTPAVTGNTLTFTGSTSPAPAAAANGTVPITQPATRPRRRRTPGAAGSEHFERRPRRTDARY